MSDSTTVATVRPGALGVGPRAQLEQQIQLRKELGEMARAFRNTLWGKDLDEATARAFATWAKRHGVDATEVCVLGGQPYIEAAFYLRKLAEMGDLVKSARPWHVGHDERLVNAMNETIPDDADGPTKAMILQARSDARQEFYRRRAARISFGLPEEAPFAVVFRVEMKDGRVYEGADWCGNKGTKQMKGRNGNYMKELDPVGDLEPRKTAETRAARRCLRLVVDTFPALRSVVEQAERDAKEQLEPAIERDLLAAANHKPRPVPILAGGEDLTGYEPGEPQAREVVEAVDDAELTEEEMRNQSPRTKAQMAGLAEILADTLFTDEERTQGGDFAVNATFGEMTVKIREATSELLRRRSMAPTPELGV